MLCGILKINHVLRSRSTIKKEQDKFISRHIGESSALSPVSHVQSLLATHASSPAHKLLPGMAPAELPLSYEDSKPDKSSAFLSSPHLLSCVLCGVNSEMSWPRSDPREGEGAKGT